MQLKLLKSVVENLINKQAAPIIDLLIGKKNVNEFLIAKKLKLTINQTRNILYKMFDYGLVSFIRKKDKRKGWYIYFWTLNIYQSLNLLEQNLKKELEQLETQLRERKEKRYYFCNTCSIEVSEENALLNDFVCSECEQVYQLSNNQESIQKLEKRIASFAKEIEFVSSEKQKEWSKLDKKKIIKFKRMEAEKRRKGKRGKKKIQKSPKKTKKPKMGINKKAKHFKKKIKGNKIKKIKKISKYMKSKKKI